MAMTKESLAAELDGREYGSEISGSEEKAAKAAGLVVVFGYSDDNVEFRGCIDDEVGVYGGAKIRLKGSRVIQDEHDCDCEFCGFNESVKGAVVIDAKWDHNGYSWYIDTEIPHAVFDILEDGENFCRGIVFDFEEVRDGDN